MTSNTTAEKRELRQRARTQRVELARALPNFAQQIVQYANDISVGEGTALAGYRAVGDEADPTPLLETLGAQGHEICYPRVHMKGHPLAFHVPIAGEPWLTGAFGIPEPRPDWPRADPAVLLVPLLAFDADGYRLGYGGGYYDRTLAHLRAGHPITAIGIAFAGQEIALVPREPNDQRLDMLVTEAGVRRFPKA